MGSGKGQVRRVRTVKAKTRTSAAVVYDEDRWLEHVRQAGLKGVAAEDYYLGDSQVDKLSVNAQELINDGLFLDAVTVGAITLPLGFSAEDFYFVVSIDPKPRQLQGKQFKGIREVRCHVSVANNGVGKRLWDPTFSYDLGIGGGYVKMFLGRDPKFEHDFAGNVLDAMSSGVERFLKHYGVGVSTP